jgi:hypothetical protein
MIQIQGFVTSQISTLADEINRWLASNSQSMDTKFRLINIKYATTNDNGKVNYSALVMYDVIESQKAEDSSEPLDASGVE